MNTNGVFSIGVLGLLTCLGCGSGDNAETVDASIRVDAGVGPDSAVTDAATPDAGICTSDDQCENGRCQSAGDCACPIPEDIPAPSSWQRTPGSPLLLPGHSHQDGTSFLLADPSALFDESSQSWKLWYAASRGDCFTCENDAVVELAESSDGISWTVQEAVSLGLSGIGWDAIRTETPDVIVDPNAVPERRYVMAYAGADQMLPLGFPNYNIGVAFSADGKTFTRVSASESPHSEEGFVLSEIDTFPIKLGATGGVVADPTLVLVDGVYHMWFSSFACADGDVCAEILEFGISHATSNDAVNWTADPANPVLEGGEQPSVIWNSQDCRFEMWMTKKAMGDGDGIPSTFNPTLGTVRAVSEDGSTWITDSERDFVWDESVSGEELGLLTGIDVAMRGAERVLFYVGMGTDSIPSGFFIPVQTSFDPAGFVPGTFGLGLATQAPSD